MITVQTTLNELFDLAKKSTNDVASKEVFIVKDLFRGFEWNRIQRGDRTKLGSIYFSYAKNEGKEDMIPLGKTPQNQQMYRKR